MDRTVREMVQSQKQELATALDRKIDEALKEKDRIRETCTAQTRDIDTHVGALRASRKQLGQLPKGRATMDSAKIAGPASVAAVEAYMRSHGRATQAKMTSDLGKNSGTITHSLRALGPRVRWTGEKIDGSKEVEWVG